MTAVVPWLPLAGRTALVTGGASGIGRACALRLGRAGATVAVVDLDQSSAEGIAAQVRLAGGNAFGLAVDVSDEQAVEAMVSEVVDRAGALHIGVLSAGVAAPSARVADVQLADWDRVLRVNLTGVFLSLRALVRTCVAAGGGSVVAIGSVLSQVGSTSGTAPYVAAKHGVLGLVRQAALDHAADGVRVNAVLPGYVATPLVAERLTAEERAERAGLQPLGRLATPDEVAHLVTWLAGDEAAFVTGACLPVDGGYLAR